MALHVDANASGLIEDIIGGFYSAFVDFASHMCGFIGNTPSIIPANLPPMDDFIVESIREDRLKFFVSKESEALELAIINSKNMDLAVHEELEALILDELLLDLAFFVSNSP